MIVPMRDEESALGVDTPNRFPMAALGGEFNGSLQHRVHSIRGGIKAQGLSRALIEAQGDLVEIALRELRQISSFREVLP